MAQSVTELSEATESKKVKEIPVVQDQGFFQHSTGDTYDGFFEAKKKDRIAKMHGPGVYTTAEGDIYTGTWENDRLGANKEVSIEYTDGSKYTGFFKEWCYFGRGTYVYPDNCILQCDFAENNPVGKLTLRDPNGHTWLGNAHQGFGWFEPVNHYYEMLEKTRETKVKRKKSKQAGNSRTLVQK